MSKVYVGCSSIHGKGVFAAADIKKGERILEIDDSRVVTGGQSPPARKGRI